MQGISDLMWPNKPLYEVLFWATALIFSQTLLYKSTASNWKFLNNAISQIHKSKYMASAMTLAALRVSEPVAETEGERERERVRGRETWIFDGFSSFFLLFQLKTGIGFTGSFGMRFSESRNGQWKPRSTTSHIIEHLINRVKERETESEREKRRREWPVKYRH